MKKIKENYTIVNPLTGEHYDTNDEKFYSENWDRTLDTKNYLKGLIKNNPEKFEGYIIESN